MEPDPIMVIEIQSLSPKTVMKQTEVARLAASWPKRAQSLQIVGQPDLEFAAMALNGIKDLRKQVAETFDPVVQAAFAAHRAAAAARKKVDEPLDQAERIIKLKIGDYTAEQCRLAEEQARIAREAEGDRLAREREAAIEEAEGAGASVEEIEALVAAPLPAPVMRPAPAPAKVAGVSVGTDYSAEVEDLLQLVGHVARNPGMVGLVQANMIALNAMARSTKGSIQLPGVRIVARPRVSARG
jgi:hypothetical protein